MPQPTTSLTLALAALFASHAQAQGLGLSPMRVEFSIEAGAEYQDSLVVANTSTEAMAVDVKALDFYIDENLEPQFREVEERGTQSCRKWIFISQRQLELGPRSQRVVSYSVHFPRELDEGSYHCAIALTTVVRAESDATLVTGVRIVAAIYGIIGSPRPAGRVTDVRLLPADTDEFRRQAAVMVENTGRTYFRVNGFFDVINARGTSVESLAFSQVPVLPGTTQRFLFPLHTDLEPGQTVQVRALLPNGGTAIDYRQPAIRPTSEARTPAPGAEPPERYRNPQILKR